jgi:MoxR-like ATPase
MSKWHIYQGTGEPNGEALKALPPAPPWRQFEQRAHTAKQKKQYLFYQVGEKAREMVNAALYLRRPLLVTGLAGTGKSSLARAVAYELALGEVLVWPITSRARIKDALYAYDAIGRLQEGQEKKKGQDNEEAQFSSIAPYITLGPLGTALADSRYQKPRVLLIDELDKSDIDLPNDLLFLFEEGMFEIPELVRRRKQESTVKVRAHKSEQEIEIKDGRVLCQEFPLVIITSNDERELPAPFLRRCLRLDIDPPTEDELENIVAGHFAGVPFAEEQTAFINSLISDIVTRRNQQNEYVAIDQLLNAVFMILQGWDLSDKEGIRKEILREIQRLG